VSRADTKSVAQAIEDEIYDRGYEGDYFPIGGAVGEAVSNTRTVVPMYVVHRNGAVVLDGDPELGFPATQPNRKTV
jgi:hypothetical protein